MKRAFAVCGPEARERIAHNAARDLVALEVSVRFGVVTIENAQLVIDWQAARIAALVVIALRDGLDAMFAQAGAWTTGGAS